MEELWKWLSQNAVALLALVLTPFLAWFFNRRTQNATAKKTDAEGTEILVTSSGKLVTSWQGLYAEIKKENEESKQQNSQLIETNQKLIEQNNVLITQNTEVKEQNTKLSQQIVNLEKRFDEYVNGTEAVITLMLSEIETSNPELARSVRDKFSEISKILSK